MAVKLSVIVPMYNTEKYIKSCVDSIKNQILEDIEIIIINDGSTDKSLEIVKNMSENCNNIIIIDKKNEGVAAARNLGIQKAKGDYVAFVESDDLISIYMYDLMYKSAIEKDADIVACNVIRFHINDDIVLSEQYESIEDEYYDNIEAIKAYIDGSISGFLCDKIFRRNLLIQNNISCPKDTFAEDIFPVLKALDNSNRIVKLNIPLYYYRYTPNSASDMNNLKNLEANLREHSHQIYQCAKYLEFKYTSQLKEQLIQFKAYQFINQLFFYNKLININPEIKKQPIEIYLKDYYSDLTLLKVLFCRYISLNYKVRYILWKLGFYSFYLNSKLK